MSKLVSLVASLVLFLGITWVGYSMLTTPEMAWSESRQKCLYVNNYKGQRIANGCQKVAEGKIKAESFPVP